MKKEYFRAINGIEVNNKIYSVSSDLNLIYAIDTCSKEVELIGVIPNEKFETKYLCGNIVKYENKIYVIPLYAENISIYHLVNREWSQIKVPDKFKELGEKFFGAVLYKKNIFLLGHKYPGICVLDVDKDAIRFIDLEDKYNLEDVLKYGFLNWDYEIQDDKLFMPLLCKNAILKMDLANEEIEEVEVGDCDCKYIGLTYAEGYFWLAPRVGNKIVKWDGKKGVEVYNLKKDYKDDLMYFGGSFYHNNKIYLTSYVGQNYVFSPNDFENGYIWKENIQFYLKCNQGVMVQNDKGDLFQINNKINNWKYTYRENMINSYIEDYYLNNIKDITSENEVYDLKNYINVIERKEMTETQNE